ncbi:hypothetical protein [Streptomyces sp. NPDC047990]|uniref:hypothetical protein n=1 Tax=Streptomyces sp. NPDC047990 TaxID=3365496 RepID=UPI003715B2E1
MDHFERELARMMRDAEEHTPFDPAQRNRLRTGIRDRRRVRSAQKAVGSVLAVAGLGAGLLLFPHTPDSDRPQAPLPLTGRPSPDGTPTLSPTPPQPSGTPTGSGTAAPDDTAGTSAPPSAPASTGGAASDSTDGTAGTDGSGATTSAPPPRSSSTPGDNSAPPPTTTPVESPSSPPSSSSSGSADTG